MRLFVLWIITASAVLSYINYTRQVKALEEQSEAYVGFAARQCAVALAFSSDDDLKVNLRELCGHQPFVAAGLYRKTDDYGLRCFTEFRPEARGTKFDWLPPDRIPQAGCRSDRLTSTVNVHFADELQGVLVLQADLSLLRRRGVLDFLWLVFGGVVWLVVGGVFRSCFNTANFASEPSKMDWTVPWLGTWISRRDRSDGRKSTRDEDSDDGIHLAFLSLPPRSWPKCLFSPTPGNGVSPAIFFGCC